MLNKQSILNSLRDFDSKISKYNNDRGEYDFLGVPSLIDITNAIRLSDDVINSYDRVKRLYTNGISNFDFYIKTPSSKDIEERKKLKEEYISLGNSLKDITYIYLIEYIQSKNYNITELKKYI